MLILMLVLVLVLVVMGTHPSSPFLEMRTKMCVVQVHRYSGLPNPGRRVILAGDTCRGDKKIESMAPYNASSLYSAASLYSEDTLYSPAALCSAVTLVALQEEIMSYPGFSSLR